MLKASFKTDSLTLAEKNARKFTQERRNQNSKNAKIFRQLGFSVVTFLRGGNAIN